MPSLILVRHSVPAVDPLLAPAAWPLSPEGGRAAGVLAGELAGVRPRRVLSSPERKARETAVILAARLGVPVEIDDGLREHERASTGFLPREAFEQGVAGLLGSFSEQVFGDETADEVFARFSAAISSARAADGASDVVAVTHGTALSIYAGRTLGLDPVQFWHGLPMPAALVIFDGGWRMVQRAGPA